jgi:hypothetical protein
MALPSPLTADALRRAFPTLKVVERTEHILEITSAARPAQVLKVTLPHLDVKPEATAQWGNAKQVFRTRPDGGHVEETSPWHEEPDAWRAGFELWLDAWLVLLSGTAEGPVRPGKP